MLQPIMHILKQKNVILASGSPRRKELIENIGLKVSLCPSVFEENLDPTAFNTFSAFVEETALQKVLEVETRLKDHGNCPDLVIGADTMVTLDGVMFGKPTSEQDAFDMLSKLSGRSHTVYTGVVVKALDKVIKFTEQTNVVFGHMDEEQIRGYIATGEPIQTGRCATWMQVIDVTHGRKTKVLVPVNTLLVLPFSLKHSKAVSRVRQARGDKAGGYGIQGVGGTFVERVEGDYFTVVGLPLYRLCSVIYDLYKEK